LVYWHCFHTVNCFTLSNLFWVHVLNFLVFLSYLENCVVIFFKCKRIRNTLLLYCRRRFLNSYLRFWLSFFLWNGDRTNMTLVWRSQLFCFIEKILNSLFLRINLISTRSLRSSKRQWRWASSRFFNSICVSWILLMISSLPDSFRWLILT
jgi:hypothetical protein